MMEGTSLLGHNLSKKFILAVRSYLTQRDHRWGAAVDVWNYCQSPHGFVVVIASIILLLLSGGAILALYTLTTRIADAQQGAEAARNLLFSIGALIAAPFVVWRTITGHWQALTARESHYTTLITKAVEQLGATQGDTIKKYTRTNQHGRTIETATKIVRPAIGLRLGAIYCLERVARDSDRDTWAILESLASYVQERSQDLARQAATSGLRGADEPLNEGQRDDVFSALRVIGRFSAPASETDKRSVMRHEYLNLQALSRLATPRSEREFNNLTFAHIKAERCDFRGTSFTDVAFQDMRLDEAVFDGVNLIDCRFEHRTSLGGTHFNRIKGNVIKFRDTPAHNAKFCHADVKTLEFYTCGLNDASFRSAVVDKLVAQHSSFDAANMRETTINRLSADDCGFVLARLFAAHMPGLIATGACEFKNASLLAANLSQSDLGDSDVESASFEDTLLAGANLSGVVNLRAEQLEQAWGDAATKLPNGIERPINERWLTNEQERDEWKKRWERRRREWIEIAELRPDMPTRDEVI